MSDQDENLTEWMFQYNPDWYDLEDSIKQCLIEDWTMFRHRDYVRVGQRIYFMRSGGQNAAIMAVGRMGSLVYEKPEETDKYLRYWVDVVYDSLVVPPLTRPEMLQDSILKNYNPYALGIHHSGFRLPPDVAARTAQLVKGRLRPIGVSDVAVDKRIFVSHSHKDNEFGIRLVGDLRRSLGGNEESVWYDASGGLQGGDAWWRTIVAELKTRPVFIVIASPDSMASPWVNDEIDLAWRQKNAPGGKAIVPIIYRACEMREDLSMRQSISFEPPTPYEQALGELLTALGLSSRSM
jgi:TIR domain/EVE domain